MRRLILLSALCVFAASASAQNTPCSGKKGGVNHCAGSAFVCNNGTVSKSKKSCDGSNKSTVKHKAKKRHRRHRK